MVRIIGIFLLIPMFMVAADGLFLDANAADKSAKRVVLTPDWKWPKKYGINIPMGIKSGNRIYVSGQAALDTNGKLIGGDDMEAQARKTFQNIEEVLKQAGATMDDVTEITAYLTDLDMKRYKGFAKARKAAFPNRMPTSTVIGVSKLLLKGMIVEISAAADVPK